MNALSVTMSLPLLLVLAGAGFNHAHGLTTFGKSSNVQNNQQAAVSGKPCNLQANCSLIKGTTCLRNYCLCGDNSHPVNGKCPDVPKAPKHICSNNVDCVDGADCLAPNEKSQESSSSSNNGDYKICQCQEELVETRNSCSGAEKIRLSSGAAFPLLVVFTAVLSMYQTI